MHNDEIGYKMTQKMFDCLLEGRSEEEKKKNPYVYVMQIINEQFGLKGKVTHIHIFDI